jgi:hypothetical protein
MADEPKKVSVAKTEKSKKEERENLTGTWDLVKKSWELFKANWKKYVVYQLIALIGLIVPIIALVVVFFKENLNELSSYVSVSGDIDPEKALEIAKNFFTNPAILLLMVLIFVISSVINLGYSKYIYQKFLGKDEVSIKESLGFAIDNFFPYLFASILVGLSVFGGLLLLVIPGLIFAVWFIFFTVVFIGEDLRGTAALKRSKDLVKGYFWPVAGRIFLFFSSTTIIDNILTKISEKSDALSILIMPVQIVFSFVVSVIGIVFIYQIYSELKQIKK